MRARQMQLRLGLGLLAMLGLAGCKPGPVGVPEKLAWRCVPLEISSIDARAQEVEMFLPGDEAHSFKLIAPDICRDLTGRASELADVVFFVRGTAKGGIKAWHPETINGKNYEVLGATTKSVPPTLQADFARRMESKR